MNSLSQKSVTLIGASRGLGRILAQTFHRLGAQALVVARDQACLDAVARDLPGVATLACDASEERAPEQVFAVQTPSILILCGGAIPPCRPFTETDWEAFSSNWDNDVRMSFHFLQAALKKPLPPGTTIITISSGAVIQGSPISGGYAGAKKMQIFMNGYAQKESDRAGLGLRFLSLAPAHLMPQTDIGKAGVTGYAAYNGVSEADVLNMMGKGQTPHQVAEAVLGLIETALPGGNFIVSAEGVSVLS